MTTDTDRADEATDLLQHLIRNGCVNDGTPASGQEARSADLLQAYLEGSGVDLETYEPAPGRTSLVARLPGSDPTAPSLTLLGHTDVVPANADDWTHDPFGGELIDGEVWGRGAIDMLNLTTTMATGLPPPGPRRLPPGGRPDLHRRGRRGGAVDLRGQVAVRQRRRRRPHRLRHHRVGRLPHERRRRRCPGCRSSSARRASSGASSPCTGTPGHASQPLRTDNALVKAAEVVRRIDEYRPQAELHEAWVRFIEGLGFPPGADRAAARPRPHRRGSATSCPCSAWPARPTPAPTPPWPRPSCTAGTKLNVIPDRVELEVDIRSLPGWETGEVRAMLEDVLGDLADDVEIAFHAEEPASTSPIDTPLWDALAAGQPHLLPRGPRPCRS